MEFALYYHGDLPANGDKVVKQKIRRALHVQLAELWKQDPLKGHRRYLEVDPKDPTFNNLRKAGGFTCAPLVCEHLAMVAEIEIDMLRPEPPGGIVSQGGDIDNRLKTLLDALRMPKDASEVVPGDKPAASEDPFFCLLEDDNLITRLAVRTDRLLVGEARKSEVHLLIRVRTRLLRGMWGNMGLH